MLSSHIELWLSWITRWSIWLHKLYTSDIHVTAMLLLFNSVNVCITNSLYWIEEKNREVNPALCCLCGVIKETGYRVAYADTWHPHLQNGYSCAHQPSVLAVIQSGFIAGTHYTVQPNGFISLTKDESSCPCVKIETSNKERCIWHFKLTTLEDKFH